MALGRCQLACGFACLLVGANAVLSHKGDFTFENAGRVHYVSYDVQQVVNDTSIIQLADFADQLINTTCNLDPSVLMVAFRSPQGASDFKARVDKAREVSDIDVFLTGHDKHGCEVMSTSSHGFLFRRVLTSPQLQGSTQVVVRTALASYGDVYSDANVSYTSRPADRNSDWQLCIGLNADPSTCAAAKAPISIYSNDALSVSCDNCFAGFKADVFFDLEISWFRLKRLAGGFKGMSVNAGLDFDMKVSYEKSMLSVDKTLFQAGGEDHPILSFNIGPIPFVLWFDSSLGLQADLRFSANAEAKAGVAMNYDIGDNYVQWQEKGGWSHVKSQPKLSITPSVSGSSSFDLTGSVTLPTSLSLHVNQVFTQTATLSPALHVNVHGDMKSKQICVNGDFDTALTTSGKLHMSILFHLVDVDAEEKPETIWSVHKDLPQICTPKPTSHEATLVV